MKSFFEFYNQMIREMGEMPPPQNPTPPQTGTGSDSGPPQDQGDQATSTPVPDVPGLLQKIQAYLENKPEDFDKFESILTPEQQPKQSKQPEQPPPKSNPLNGNGRENPPMGFDQSFTGPQPPQ